MTESLSAYAYDILKEAFDEFIKECDCSETPALLAIGKKKANDRVAILRKTAVDANYLDERTINELVSGGYLQPIKNCSLLALTAKGVWEVEFRTEPKFQDNLIAGINQMFFDEFTKLSITPRNKLVLFAMIAMRSFTKESCVDVRMDKGVYDHWWNIFLEVNDFLIKMGVMAPKDSIRDQKEKSGIESDASDLIRHSDRIPRFTDNIFTKSGKNQYWLELVKTDKEIDISKLSVLIKKILGDKINEDNCKEYWEFANNLCLDYSYLIAPSLEDISYLSCDYDVIIRRSFEKSTMITIN